MTSPEKLATPESLRELTERLSRLAVGTVEWRVADPETRAYCIAFTRREELDPENAAREWLKKHIAEFPRSPHANKVVVQVRCFSELERAALEAVAALRLATQRQGEGDGWQPIETAPKDGRTLLLGYFNSHGKWRTLRGQWFSEAHINDNWEEECEEGWYETSVECGDDVNCWKTEPTHFMFLPAAPGATSQGVAVAQPDAPPCETCNGNGMIGGPCYREPDEGGVPCPDCGPAGAAQGEVK